MHSFFNPFTSNLENQDTMTKNPYFIYALVLVLALLSASPIEAAERSGAQEEAAAASTSPEPLSLEAALEMAMNNDRQLRIARLEVGIAGNQAEVARSYLLPQVSFSASKFWLKDPIELSLPDFGLAFTIPDEFPLTYSATVAVPLFVGETIPSYMAARQLVMKEEEVAERTRQNLVHDVTVAYFSILQSQRVIEVVSETVGLLEALAKQADDFYQEGLVDRRDYLTAQLRLAEVRQQLISAEKQHALAVSMFNKMIGRDIDAQTTVVDADEVPSFEAELAHCQTLAQESRPELRQLNAQVKAARLALQAAKQGLLPRFAAFASAQHISSEYFEEDWVVYGGLQIDFDLYNGGKNWAQIGEASKRNLQASLALHEATEGIKLQVKDAYLSLREAEKRLGVTETAIEQARENLRIVEDQYAVQMVSSTEVLDAHTYFMNARNNHLQAIYQMHLAVAQLEWALGTELTPVTKQGAGLAAEQGIASVSNDTTNAMENN